MSSIASLDTLGENAGLTPSRLPHRLSSLRGHAAFVRTLLDEIERVAPPGATTAAISEQLVEELALLGARFVELAKALSVESEALAEHRRCA